MAGTTVARRMASIPRLPLVPDLLRRIHVPDDLDAVTSIGEEDGAAAGGLEEESVERIWKSAARSLPKRRPSRRAGVRAPPGRGRPRPHDRPRARQRPARRRRRPRRSPPPPATPFCVYSASKAITAFVVHVLAERGVLALDDPVAKHIPGYERNGKEEITIGHVLAHRAGVPNLPARGDRRPRPAPRPRLPRARSLSDAKPFARARKAPRLPRGLGRLHPRRGRPPRHRQGHPRRSSPRRSSTRSGSDGPTTASARRTSTRWRRTTSRARRWRRRSPIS